MSTGNLNLLLGLSEIASQAERDQFTFQNPAVLSESVQEDLAKQILSFSDDEKARFAPLVQRLVYLRTLFEKDITQYPLGFGPIEDILIRQENGQISIEYAEKLARSEKVTSMLSQIYIRAISNLALDCAHENNWRRAVNLHRLLAAAVQATPDSGESKRMRWRVDYDWIEIAAIALVNIPDGRIYRSAMEAGKRAAEMAQKSNNEVFGTVLHRLGSLNSDPYVAGRSSANYWLQMQQWRQRLSSELGSEMATIPPNELKMPSPEDALKEAENYYRQAVSFRNGNQKGFSLKALAQTLEWEMMVFKQTIDQKELVQVCLDALGLLDAVSEPEVRLDVLAILSRTGYPVDQAEVQKTLLMSPDEMVRALGRLRALLLVEKASEAMEEKNPAQSLELLKNSRFLFEQYGNEKEKTSRWLRELRLMDKVFPTAVPTDLSAGGMKTVVEAILKQADTQKWDIQKESASLICLASKSPTWNEESLGLRMIEEARKIAPVFTRDYDDALNFLKATLNMNVGVNGVNSGDFKSAIPPYALAIRQYLDLGLESAAMDCLERINDLASKGGFDAGQEVVVGLAPLVQVLETKVGESAERLIQHICKRALAGMSGHAINPEVLFFLLQIAKGQRFAKALYAGSRYHWREDARGIELLQQIKEAKSALPPNSPALIPPDPKALLSEDTFLTSYTTASVGESGDEAEERFANLQRRYDQYLSQHLLASTESDDVLYFSSEDIQSAIDERTVLFDFFIGATADGLIGLYVIALTREDFKVSLIAHQFPDSEVLLGDGEASIKVNPLALTIEQLRTEIQKKPEKEEDILTPDAADLLENTLIGYFGPFVQYLDELSKQGKDHLCIVPHGPLHYFPFHLLGKPGKPLASNWKITYLPNLHLLTSNRGAPAVRRFRKRTIAAFGLSFMKKNPFKLKPTLPEAIKESKGVAAVFSEEPVLEDDATETNFLSALTNSRYVHLATHGRQNVNAPAFHCVFLSPDKDSDGVLTAHELLSLDLRGLDVLTLSACETALGRFDASDNLRGLPASFLLAGVSTLIGTLWSVETHSAECFFQKFYQELKGGASRLDAFASAQAETRKAYPQYRDWGAFYLIGDWL